MIDGTMVDKSENQRWRTIMIILNDDDDDDDDVMVILMFLCSLMVPLSIFVLTSFISKTRRVDQIAVLGKNIRHVELPQNLNVPKAINAYVRKQYHLKFLNLSTGSKSRTIFFKFYSLRIRFCFPVAPFSISLSLACLLPLNL